MNHTSITPDPTLKQCSQCKQWLPCTSFHKAKREKDGLRHCCKECRTRIQSDRMQDSQYRETYNNRQREWVRDKLQDDEYRAKYNEHQREYKRQRYQTDEEYRDYTIAKEHKRMQVPEIRERRNQKASERYAAKSQDPEWREKENQRTREYKHDPVYRQRELDRQRERLQDPEYHQRHNARKRITGHNRRALKRELPHEFTQSDWQHCLEYFHNTCAYCGAQQSFWFTLEQEHYTPITRGGGYTSDNIIPACKTCNSSKGNTPPTEWLEDKFGRHKANKIIAAIETYFDIISRIHFDT